MNSTKSMIGHLLGAAGAVEAVAVVKAIQKGILHPNCNISSLDPDVDSDIIVGDEAGVAGDTPRPQRKDSPVE